MASRLRTAVGPRAARLSTLHELTKLAPTAVIAEVLDYSPPPLEISAGKVSSWWAGNPPTLRLEELDGTRHPARRIGADPPRAWLDYRSSTWPNSINPHLLIDRRTAPRLVAAGHSFPWKNTAFRPQALWEDRILLHEIRATGGDVRRLCDLFGPSVEGATRYLKTIEHPDLATEGGPVSRS